MVGRLTTMIYHTGNAASRHDSRATEPDDVIPQPQPHHYMTGVHLHLLVNHAPIFGAVFALALFLASYRWAPDVLRRTAFVLLIFTGFAGVAADLTGQPAEDAVRGLPGIRREVIHEHEELGQKSYIVAAVVGVLAIGLLVRGRNLPISSGVAATGLVASLIVSGMMAYTGLLGGRVRHTEVRPGATPADAAVVEPPRQPRPNP